ncbi:hypothetical protein ABTF88_21320, partial [Acinetobacter baumannii]
DPAKGELGSYDAIRVYLWAGMTSPRDPQAAPLLAALDGMRQRIVATGIAPEPAVGVRDPARRSDWGLHDPRQDRLGDGF